VTTGINSALAARVGTLTVRPGPEASFAEGVHLVADLRNQIGKAFGYVAEITGLAEAAQVGATAETVVVDRPGLVRSLIRAAESLTAPIWTEEELSWAARQTASAQLGAIAGVMAYRVLGHYDPFFTARSGSAGRIVLCAPNVLRFERELAADPRDFHLWVALHEVTHAVQFAAAPWLVDWLRNRLDALMEADPGPGGPGQLLAAAKKLPELFADGVSPDVPARILSPEQSRLVAELTAAMSLLEGHADVIMDAVGPKVVKTVEQLRPKFEARRVARGRFERALRRLAGLEAKSAQYLQGAAFVRAGLATLGHEGFNAVFASPSALPTAAEMDYPAAWTRRVGQAGGG
jgi:coenzyme F420 biosynthesis associated uncharacterized protein